MKKEQKASRKAAFSGVICALSLVCLFLSSLFPFAEYTCPTLAGLLFVALVVDFGKKYAFAAYGASALLSLFLIPNKEAAVLFVAFFGYYPIVKSIYESLRSRALEWIFKFATFNAAVVGAYWILIHALGMTELLSSMSGGYQYGLLVFWILGNLTFFIYDLAISRVIAYYIQKLRPKLRRKNV